MIMNDNNQSVWIFGLSWLIMVG